VTSAFFRAKKDGSPSSPPYRVIPVLLYFASNSRPWFGHDVQDLPVVHAVEIAVHVGAGEDVVGEFGRLDVVAVDDQAFVDDGALHHRRGQHGLRLGAGQPRGGEFVDVPPALGARQGAGHAHRIGRHVDREAPAVLDAPVRVAAGADQGDPDRHAQMDPMAPSRSS